MLSVWHAKIPEYIRMHFGSVLWASDVKTHGILQLKKSSSKQWFLTQILFLNQRPLCQYWMFYVRNRNYSTVFRPSGLQKSNINADMPIMLHRIHTQFPWKLEVAIRIRARDLHRLRIRRAHHQANLVEKSPFQNWDYVSRDGMLVGFDLIPSLKMCNFYQDCPMPSISPRIQQK